MVGRWSRLNGLRSGYVRFRNRFKIELTKRYNMVSIMDSLVEKYIKQYHAINRFGNAEEIAPFVLLLASKHASFASGCIIPIDGGIL